MILLAIGTRAGFVSQTMRHFAYLIVLATTWCAYVHAQDLPHNDAAKEAHSALPWLNLDSLSPTRDRPLFVPGRRKPSPPPVVTAPLNPAEAAAQVHARQEPQLQLTGIVVSPAETIVLLRNPTTSQSIAIHPGESVGPWRVFVDSNYTVTVKTGPKTFTLEMFAEPDSRMRMVQ